MWAVLLNLPGLKAWDSDASGFPMATAVGADFPEGSAFTGGALGAGRLMPLSSTADPLRRVSTGEPPCGSFNLWILGKLDTGCTRSGSAPGQALRAWLLSSNSNT